MAWDKDDELKKKYRHKRAFRRKHRFLALTFIIAVIVFLFVSAGIYSRVSFLLHEEIILQISPRYAFLEVERANYEEHRISVEVQSTWMCNAECTQELVNKGTGEKLFQNTFVVTGRENIEFDYWFGTEEHGYGQEYYTYTVTCKAIPTTLCSAENPERIRVSTITVNYEPLMEEKTAESSLAESFPGLSSLIRSADSNLLTSHARLERTRIQKQDLQQLLSKKNTSLLEIETDINNVVEFWKQNDFLKAKSYLDESRLLPRAQELTEATSELVQAISERVDNHNQAVQSLQEIYHNRFFFNDLFRTSRANTDLTSMFLDATAEHNEITTDFNTDSFSGYEELLGRILNSTNFFAELQEEYVKGYVASTDDYVNLLLEEFSSCVSNNAWCEPASLSSVINNNISIGEALRNTRSKCTTARRIIDENNIIMDEKLLVVEQLDPETRAQAEKEKSRVMLSVILGYEEELFELGLENTSAMLRVQEHKEFFEGELNEAGITKDYYPFSYNESLREYFLPVRNEMVERLDERCTPTNMSLQFEELTRSIEEMPLEYQESSKHYELPEVLAMCCAYGECKPCCEHGCEKSNPLILLHGHAFRGKHTPEYSTDAFNDILSFLTEEQLYLPMATLTPEKKFLETKEGDLGRNHKPIAMKATYYYIAYIDGPGYKTIISKSENIDTYAIRLEEMISWVKKATGADQVDIIAHSMGGLVARRYIQVFGEDSVDKLIMIGTPNHGITPRLARLCSVFGEEKECRDMEENSSFMNTLNAQGYRPEKVEMHTIRAEGCTMEGGDGDGIVLGNRVPLDYAENHVVRRDCDIFEESPHTDMLSPEKYPEVYEMIKNILGPGLVD